ncbi:MAG: peptidylprolyl isomerase [Phycisphaerae bacterium]|nr:peptidylprolyl isomerase [Phycisphaerae bacterium]
MSATQARRVRMAGAAILLLLAGAACNSSENFFASLFDRKPESSAASQPVLAANTAKPATQKKTQPAPAAKPVTRTPGSVAADILLVNNHSLTVAEALYALPARAANVPANADPTDEARMRVFQRVQQDVGALLIYDQAANRLNDRQREALDKAVEQQIHRRVDMEFGGSQARFEAHLADNELSLSQHRDWLKRQFVTRDYLRSVLLPKASITRDDLLAEFEKRKRAPTAPQTRRLRMIAAPHRQFAAESVVWDRATPQQKSAARAAAEAHIRAAETAIAGGRDFADVAGEYDRSPHQADGGDWGYIGKPLRGMFEEPTRRIFSMKTGERSQPIFTGEGAFLVQCEDIRGGAFEGDFESVQHDLRIALEDERFNQVARDYLTKLSESASISSIGDFVEVAAARLMKRQARAPLAE